VSGDGALNSTQSNPWSLVVLKDRTGVLGPVNNDSSLGHVNNDSSLKAKALRLESLLTALVLKRFSVACHIRIWSSDLLIIIILLCSTVDLAIIIDCYLGHAKILLLLLLL